MSDGFLRRGGANFQLRRYVSNVSRQDNGAIRAPLIPFPGGDPGADPGGGRWGARPPLGRSFPIQNALFNSIQAPVHHWATTPGRNPVSAPGIRGTQYMTKMGPFYFS